MTCPVRAVPCCSRPRRPSRRSLRRMHHTAWLHNSLLMATRSRLSCIKKARGRIGHDNAPASKLSYPASRSSFPSSSTACAGHPLHSARTTIKRYPLQNFTLQITASTCCARYVARSRFATRRVDVRLLSPCFSCSWHLFKARSLYPARCGLHRFASVCSRSNPPQAPDPTCGLASLLICLAT